MDDDYFGEAPQKNYFGAFRPGQKGAVSFIRNRILFTLVAAELTMSLIPRAVDRILPMDTQTPLPPPDPLHTNGQDYIYAYPLAIIGGFLCAKLADYVQEHKRPYDGGGATFVKFGVALGGAMLPAVAAEKLLYAAAVHYHETQAGDMATLGSLAKALTDGCPPSLMTLAAGSLLLCHRFTQWAVSDLDRTQNGAFTPTPQRNDEAAPLLQRVTRYFRNTPD